jgi:hypothetical protein
MDKGAPVGFGCALSFLLYTGLYVVLSWVSIGSDPWAVVRTFVLMGAIAALIFWAVRALVNSAP